MKCVFDDNTETLAFLYTSWFNEAYEKYMQFLCCTNS